MPGERSEADAEAASAADQPVVDLRRGHKPDGGRLMDRRVSPALAAACTVCVCLAGWAVIFAAGYLLWTLATFAADRIGALV